MRYENLPINIVELDLNNPRISQWIKMYGNNLSSEAIALALGGGEKASSYASLKESIKVNGGIINPITVNKDDEGKYTVIEGNTRLQIYKEFANSDPEGPWAKIPALVYDNMPIDEIHAIRLQTHLVGPRDWDAFSKGKYLHQLSEIDKMPMSKIISFCGGQAAEIRGFIDAYVDMNENYFSKAEEYGMDPDPREFSKFREAQKRPIQEAIAAHGYTREDFAKWVINGNIDTAQNVRKLPQILADSDVRKVFLSANVSEAEKYLYKETANSADLSKCSIDELVVALTMKVRNIPRKEEKELLISPNAQRKRDNIRDLKYEIEELIADMED